LAIADHRPATSTISFDNSEARGDTVPEFLISPGLSLKATYGERLGRDNAVSDGNTPTGRKQDRPVEARSEQ